MSVELNHFYKTNITFEDMATNMKKKRKLIIIRGTHSMGDHDDR